jgi:hypothetical protein
MGTSCAAAAAFSWTSPRGWDDAALLSRRNVLDGTTRRTAAAAAAFTAVVSAGGAGWIIPSTAANAFEGSGSSVYSGRNPATQAVKVKSYRDRVVADVRDFNALGRAIQSNDDAQGLMDDAAWFAFFTPLQRRTPDSVGRSYAALVDLCGQDASGGGAGLLLAGSYAKPGKPPDNLPQYRRYNALTRSLTDLQKAAAAANNKTGGDGGKVREAWSLAATALSQYLESVDLPADLSNPLYSQ